MQLVAQNWLVMELTGSTAALGSSVMLQALPGVVLALWGGLLADRVSRRGLLMVTQGLHAVLALAIGALLLTGALSLPLLLVMAVLTGILSAVEGPSGTAFGAELVPAELLPNAIALGSAIGATGRLVGMAVAGAIVGIAGPEPVFVINGVSYVVVLGALATIRVDELQAATRSPRLPGQLREGARHLVTNRRLLVTVALAFVLAAFGRSYQVTMAAMTAGPLGTGAEGYGLASTIFAAGALGGAFLAARLAHLSSAVLCVAAVTAGVFQVLAGLAPTMASFLFALVPAALGAVVIDTALSSIVQLEGAAALRGRLLSLLGVVSMAGAALGGPMLGSFAELLGARTSLVLGGVTAGLATLVAHAAYQAIARTTASPRPLPAPAAAPAAIAA